MALTGISFYFLTVDDHNDLKEIVEDNGGVVVGRICRKPDFIISNSTKGIQKKDQSKIKILSEDFIHECIKQNKVVDYAPYFMNGNTFAVYDFHTPKAKKRPHSNKGNKAEEEAEPARKTVPAAGRPRKSLKHLEDPQEVVRDVENKVEVEPLPQAVEEIREVLKHPEKPLEGLKFAICGNSFSLPRDTLCNIILQYGGDVLPTVDEKVTHLLFGGDDVNVEEFVTAQKLKIHIVNEYFLRLLVKW